MSPVLPEFPFSQFSLILPACLISPPRAVNLHRISWPFALTPTPPTSFCEEDYVITFYLAEFINALTNIAYGV